MGEIAEKGYKIILEKFGEGAVMRMGDRVNVPVDVIPTGIIGIDVALGVGGIPRGRITEIFGPNSCGKTTLALHVLKEAQDIGLVCAYIDAEHALDVTYAAALGINIDDVYISQPGSAEEGLAIAEIWCKTGDVGVVVVDSVDALVPEAIIEGELGQERPGLHARLMSQSCRRLTSLVSDSNTAMVFINQIREKVMVTYGPTEYTPGGRALGFYSSVRIDMRKSTAIKNKDEEKTGNLTKIEIVKNKVSIPHKKVEVDIVYGQGIDRLDDLIETGVSAEVVRKSGSTYYYGEQKLGAGIRTAIEFLRDNGEICIEIRDDILKAKGINT